MSNKKKAVPTGIRYTEAQKNEVVDFVIQHNAKNGRGGQSAAAKQFKITPLTIGAWLKAAGAPSPGKKIKPATRKAGKSVSGSNSKKGMRYTPEQKQEVVDFVSDYNAANGRGGQSQAAKKFNLSVLTVSSWLKAAGAPKPKGGAAQTTAAVGSSAPAVPASLLNKVSSLIELSDEIRKTENDLARLKARFDSVKDSVRSVI